MYINFSKTPLASSYIYDYIPFVSTVCNAAVVQMLSGGPLATSNSVCTAIIQVAGS